MVLMWFDSEAGNAVVVTAIETTAAITTADHSAKTAVKAAE